MGKNAVLLNAKSGGARSCHEAVKKVNVWIAHEANLHTYLLVYRALYSRLNGPHDNCRMATNS